MPFVGAWCKVWIYFGFVFAWTKGARPRFDTSTDMGLVLVPADAEVDSVIFRLRATDQDADFPLVFEITATITPVVRIDNLPCTLYNKVCQANVILTKRLVPGRLHDFAVRVKDTKGDSNSMQATISVTNATTPRDKIFPHIPSLIMVPEDTKPGKELDYLLVRANPWSGKPVYIELWQPKELFTIRQRQTPTQTRGVITLIGELDFETQSMYTLTMYATDPYTEPGKDTRNIAGLSVVVVVQDVQDVPPIFTLTPPLTRINNSVQPGDIVLRVHAEDGDKGVPREIVYGLVSEGNPFTPFFNISETSGEITLARPLEELTQITHVGAPVVLTVVAEELRRSREEPPAQATVVDVGFLLGEPGNSPPYFESDNYIATIDENPEPGTMINFGEQYSTRVKDEDIGKAGVFALKLENNNGTFEINPTVAERTADFVISVRDNALIDYELYKSLTFKVVAQEVGPATNLSASVPVTIFLKDVNDNPPVFEEESYEVTLSENVTAGSRVVQVHATDKDTGIYGSIRYTSITGEGSEAFTMNSDSGLITVTMGSSLDREAAEKLVLSAEARDENGNGNRGVVPLIVNLLDVNDNAPTFEKSIYQFTLNAELTNFTSPAFIKAMDADAEPPNNIVRYEIVHGNYENKFYLNETSGELILRSPITKIRRKKQSAYDNLARKTGKEFVRNQEKDLSEVSKVSPGIEVDELLKYNQNRSDETELIHVTEEMIKKIVRKRQKRADDNALYTLTARAYDLGVPHLSSETQIQISSGIAMEARIMMFVVPGEHPDSEKTAETLATITGGRVTVLQTRPYIEQNHVGNSNLTNEGKRSIVIVRVEQTEAATPLVDVEKIRKTLAANGVGIIGGTDAVTNATMILNDTKASVNGVPQTNGGQITNINNTITSVQNEEVTVYKAENKLLLWLLIILGLLMLVAIATLIICCICPGCPFYMAPRKRRVHSSETLVVKADGRPKRHLHRQPPAVIDVTWNGRKQAWSADPTRRNWQFNKRNVKNCGLSSLPCDVAYISNQQNDGRINVETLRLRDEPTYNHSRRSRLSDQERMYMEDVEGQKIRGYGATELDSLQRHDIERGSDLQRQSYRQRYTEADVNEGVSVREQHFYREGNAEVLRLVTRGQVEDTVSHHRLHHQPTTVIIDGKDIILQRFIEDQNSRHELSMQDTEAARSMESHQRPKEIVQQQQPEIILIPNRLDLGHRKHVEELGPNVQRLVIDHNDYDSLKVEKESQIKEATKQERHEGFISDVPVAEKPPGITKEHVQSTNAEYSFHDLELAKQNALLTRLLLERESRQAAGGMIDSTSYLETQSLPGQVAIATQTDRTTATQTERHIRSRSDNDDSDEDARQKKKLKSRKKYGDGDWKRSRTLWMKSPIEEEGSPCFDKRLSILRRKVREVKDGRKTPLEPRVLREISDSLDGNGSSCNVEEDGKMESYRESTQQTSIRYKVLNEEEDGSPSTEEMPKNKDVKTFDRRSYKDSHTLELSTSSPEIKTQREKLGRERAEEKSPKKTMKSKVQKKSDGVIKPSFKILEKEFSMLTKKLSKLGNKKFQESTGSDSTSQDKSESFSKDSKKGVDQKNSKKPDALSTQGQKQVSEMTDSKTEQKSVQKKDTTAIAKTKQKLRYQQAHVMSTGSSEYDDGTDKLKKQSSTRHESKQKQAPGTQSHSKVKRPMISDRKELRKQYGESRDDEVERKKDGLPKEASKMETKTERAGKMVTRTQKLTSIHRKDNVSEEFSTSTNSDRTLRKKNGSSTSDREKKSGTDSSEKDSNIAHRQREQSIAKKVLQRFSDDFIEESKPKNAVTAFVKEERRAETVKTKESVSKEKLSPSGSITLANNKQENKDTSIERSTKSKDLKITKGIDKTSVAPSDVAEKLIQKSGILDTPRGGEKTLPETAGKRDQISPKKMEPEPGTVTKKLVKQKGIDEQLDNVNSVRKESEKNGTRTGEAKNIVAKEAATKVIDKLEKNMEDKLLEHGNEKISKTENVLEEHQKNNRQQSVDLDSNLQPRKEEMSARSEISDSKEEVAVDVIQTLLKMKDKSDENLNKEREHGMNQAFAEQRDMLIEELGREIDQKMTPQSTEQKETHTTMSDSKTNVKIEDVKSKQNGQLKAGHFLEIPGLDQINVVQKAEELFEKHLKPEPIKEMEDVKEKVQSELKGQAEKDTKIVELNPEGNIGRKGKEGVVDTKTKNPEGNIGENGKEGVVDTKTKHPEERNIDVNIPKGAHKEEETAMMTNVDDNQMKEGVFLDKKQISNAEKEPAKETASESLKIAEHTFLENPAEMGKEKVENVKDAHEMSESASSLEQEEKVDKEKETAKGTKIDGNTINETGKATLDTELSSTEKLEAGEETKIDDHESKNKDFFRDKEQNIVDGIGDDHTSKENIFPVTKAKAAADILIDKYESEASKNIFLDAAEKNIQIGSDRQVDQSGMTFPIKEEASTAKQIPTEKEVITREKNKENIVHIDEKEKYPSVEKETISMENSNKTEQKNITLDKEREENVEEIQMDSPSKLNVKEKDIEEIPENKLEFIHEGKDDLLKKKSFVDLKKDDDDTHRTMADSSQISSEKRDPEEVSMKEQSPERLDVKDQINKQNSIFSEINKPFQTLTDKLTSDSESNSIIHAERKDVEHTFQSPSEINKKETALRRSDEMNTNEIDGRKANEISALHVESQSANVFEKEDESTDVTQIENAEENIKTMTTKDNTVISPSQEILKNGTESGTTKQEEESNEIENVTRQSTGKIEKGAEVTTVKQDEESNEFDKEADKSLFDQIESIVEAALHIKETVEKEDKLVHEHEEIIQKGTENSTNLSDNETIDPNIVQTDNEKDQMQEPVKKTSSSFPKTELPVASKLPHEAPRKEMSAVDSEITDIPTESIKVSTPENELKKADQQAELQDVKQTTLEEIKIQPSPEDKSSTEEDMSTITQSALNKEGTIEESVGKSIISEENVAMNTEKEVQPIEADSADVSLPLFSSILDTMDDSDDSDSSSDISRKTTLTTRPYHTPRHHSRQSPEKETAEYMEDSGPQNIADKEDASLTIQLVDDKNAEFLKDDNIHAEKEESENVNNKQASPIRLLDTNAENVEANNQKEPIMSARKPLYNGKTIPDSSLKNNENKTHVEPISSSEFDREHSSAAKRTKNENLESDIKILEQSESTSNSKHTKTAPSKIDNTKVKEKEKKKFPVKKKKSSSEESSEEKATRSQGKINRSRQRIRKHPVDNQSRQKDSDRIKGSKESEKKPRRKESISKLSSEKDKKSSSGEKYVTPPKTGEIDTSKAQPKYMAWYKKNREDMEKKRAELMATDDEEQLPRWLRRSIRNQKQDKDEKQKTGSKSPNSTPRTRKKVKPLVNVESEQLKAIVRQGRKLRRAAGGKNEDPPVQIFAAVPPAPTPGTKHHLVQHSEYKYEKVPAPFYLHPPPAPHPSPQLSPEHFDIQQTMEHGHMDENFDSGIAISLQSGNRLRHQQLLEKKSVFDIAYNEAAPSQLRSDSTTPPS